MRAIDPPAPSAGGFGVDRMVADTDVADDVERLLRGTPGASKGEVRNPYGVVGRPEDEINRNNVTDNLTSDPDLIPFAPAPRVRDYARESKQGNSVGYTLRGMLCFRNAKWADSRIVIIDCPNSSDVVKTFSASALDYGVDGENPGFYARDSRC